MYLPLPPHPQNATVSLRPGKTAWELCDTILGKVLDWTVVHAQLRWLRYARGSAATRAGTALLQEGSAQAAAGAEHRARSPAVSAKQRGALRHLPLP